MMFAMIALIVNQLKNVYFAVERNAESSIFFDMIDQIVFKKKVDLEFFVIV